MRLAWLTDIHLDLVEAAVLDRFLKAVADGNPDLILISGDIGTAETIVDYLVLLRDRLTSPIYFVLGNHDFFGGSIEDVRERVMKICGKS